MAGVNNTVLTGNGVVVKPTDSTDAGYMQQEATDVGVLNSDGSPEGVLAANASSLCMDRTNGVLYLKESGTGNTGWTQIDTGTGDVVGPGPLVTDNAVPVFDGTGGLTIKESGVIVDGSNNVTGVNQLDVDSANGIHFNPGSDTDTDVITVGVTGSPKIKWDESANGFNIDTGLVVGDSDGDLSHTVNGAVVNSDLEIHAQASQDLGGLTIHRHTDTALWGAHILSLRSNGTHASPTIVADNDNIARVIGAGYDGTDYALCAEMLVQIDGTPGNDDMPGRFVWSTSPDGTQVPVEGMRLDSSQKLTLLNLDVDNININGNTISSIDTNGNIEITPDGTGNVNLNTNRVLQTLSTAGSVVSTKIDHSDNTNTGSHAGLILETGGTSGGDPYVRYAIAGTTSWHSGRDNTGGGFMVGRGGSDPSGATVYQQFSDAGEITYPLQPMFQAYLGTTTGGVTGNGTNVRLGDTDVMSSLTEVKDQGGDFNPGSADGAILTAPVDAQWVFMVSILFQTAVGSATSSDYAFVTSNRSYRGAYHSFDPSGIDTSNALGTSASFMADMDAADTFYFSTNMNGVGADTVTMNGSAGRTNLSGWQLG